MNIFPRAQRFEPGEPCIQIAWSERPNFWMNFEELKPHKYTAAEQVEAVRKQFIWMKVNANLAYDILIRVAPAQVKRHNVKFGVVGNVDERPRYIGQAVVGRWAWVPTIAEAQRWVREEAYAVAHNIRKNWRCQARVEEINR